MDCKVGDKLLCKCNNEDNFIRSGNYTYGKDNYTYGKSYKILRIDDNMIYLSFNNSYDKDDFDPTKHEYYGFHVDNIGEDIWEYFYTKEESRKIKLEKLNELI